MFVGVGQIVPMGHSLENSVLHHYISFFIDDIEA
jgi:hypothetical protein